MSAKEKLARRTKDHMVSEVKERIKTRSNFVLTHYMGSSVSDLELLRRNLKKSSSSYFVVKNSVLKVALDELKLNEFTPLVDSGMGVSICGQDPAVTCKELVEFAKTHDKFKIKGAYLDGSLVTADKVKAIASLPSRAVLLSQVVGGIKSPITGFVLVLAGTLRKFVYCINAIKTEREKAGPVAASAVVTAALEAAPAIQPEPPKPAA